MSLSGLVAVLVATLAVLLVKLGVVAGVAW